MEAGPCPSLRGSPGDGCHAPASLAPGYPVPKPVLVSLLERGDLPWGLETRDDPPAQGTKDIRKRSGKGKQHFSLRLEEEAPAPPSTPKAEIPLQQFPEQLAYGTLTLSLSTV
eukprot:bmy_18934T0